MSGDYTDITTDMTNTLARIAAADDLLHALTITAMTLRPNVEHLERALVHELRDRGESWAVIGSALGVSRQSAHERFATT